MPRQGWIPRTRIRSAARRHRRRLSAPPPSRSADGARLYRRPAEARVDIGGLRVEPLPPSSVPPPSPRGLREVVLPLARRAGQTRRPLWGPTSTVSPRAPPPLAQTLRN